MPAPNTTAMNPAFYGNGNVTIGQSPISSNSGATGTSGTNIAPPVKLPPAGNTFVDNQIQKPDVATLLQNTISNNNTNYGNPTTGPQGTTPVAPPAPPSATDQAFAAYIKSLQPSTDVTNAQQTYNDFTANEDKSVAGLSGRGLDIPLSIVRGQQALLKAQADPEAARLQNNIGIAQNSAAAISNAAKANADYLQSKDTNAANLAKPISVGIGSTPYALNPATGKYEPINSSTPGSTGNNTDVTSAYVNGINNGSITSIASVPAAYRNDVAVALAKTGVTTPLADSRNSLASTRIAANFIALPQYQLTANGLPYLQRIDAAEKTPGSISDADLLDALTKLDTAGNAITDSQVSLITGGKSFSDSINVLQNKLANGGVLSDNQRQQIQSLAKAIYANYQKGYQPVYDQVTSQLTAAGIPKQFWTIPDLNNLSALSGLDSSSSPNGSSNSLTSSPSDPNSPFGDSFYQ